MIRRMVSKMMMAFLHLCARGGKIRAAQGLETKHLLIPIPSHVDNDRDYTLDLLKLLQEGLLYIFGLSPIRMGLESSFEVVSRVVPSTTTKLNKATLKRITKIIMDASKAVRAASESDLLQALDPMQESPDSDSPLSFRRKKHRPNIPISSKQPNVEWAITVASPASSRAKDLFATNPLAGPIVLRSLGPSFGPSTFVRLTQPTGPSSSV
ncbi:hypothetical protein ZIOFF_029196 [Zingiber officinale]|uniref:Uncharacterized protein n=1 Tax=Zingiber officinale TaxID=94328 RepID=A0A8J5GWA7_ZINOF|nr:hypothetical protein ZIOFF_029196 [Zingiber officinale]